MEPSQLDLFEEHLHQMVSLGMYQTIGTLIRDYPYVVIHVDISDHGIFVLLGYNFIVRCKNNPIATKFTCRLQKAHEYKSFK
jgi:hypothetical protein